MVGKDRDLLCIFQLYFGVIFKLQKKVWRAGWIADLKASPGCGPVVFPHIALSQLVPTRHQTGLQLDRPDQTGLRLHKDSLVASLFWLVFIGNMPDLTAEFSRHIEQLPFQVEEPGPVLLHCDTLQGGEGLEDLFQPLLHLLGLDGGLGDGVTVEIMIPAV